MPHRAIVASVVFIGLIAGASGQCSDVPAFPFGDGAESRFGTAVAISADATVALASGPFYLQSLDGTARAGGVRTFSNDGSGWVEGQILRGDEPPTLFGEAFGQAVAMDDAATVAIVGAYSNSEEGNFSGRVYVFERNTSDGTWSKVDEWGLPPGLGIGQAFGWSLEITPDGSRVIAGSFGGAWTRDRDGAGWTDWSPLTPATAFPNNIDWGMTVAISDDGTLAALRAEAISFFDPGRVLIFENTGGGWTEIARVEEKGADANGSSFGSHVAFDGDTLIALDASFNDSTAQEIFGSPLFIYERSGGTYPTDPIVLFPPDSLMPTAAFGFPVSNLSGGIAIRGDTMLVGAPRNSTAPLRGGRVFKLERIDDVWTFTDRFGIESDIILNDAMEFGADVDLAADEATFVIGEPGGSIGDDRNVGRVHFPDRVFDNAEFEINPIVTSVVFVLNFPLVDTQVVEVMVDGAFDLRYGVACEGDTDLVAMESATLGTTEDSYTIVGPLGVPVTYSDITVTLVAPTAPAGVGSMGEFVLAGTFEVSAMQKIGILPASPITTEGFVEPIPAVITSGESATAPLTFSVPEFTFSGVLDFGFGDNNPSVDVMGTLAADVPVPCNGADLAPPFGITDLADVDVFIPLFLVADVSVDVTQPFGVVDLSDLDAFIELFLAGCP
ncbi:MAG: GC-type dockerin domain-anchored protein [Planctomycetota bacterium]